MVGGAGEGCVSSVLLQAAIPSSCGILVQRKFTSRVTSMDPGGNGPSVDSLHRKSVVSVKYDGICLTRGHKWLSTNSEIHSLCIA